MPAAESLPQKYFGSLKAWPIRLEPIDLPVDDDHRAVGLGWECDLGDGGHDDRVGDAGDQGHREQDRECWPEGVAKKACHQIVLGEMEGSHDEVDRLDPDERGDQPAEAVDEEVALEELARRRRPEADAPEGDRDERDDDQAR